MRAVQAVVMAVVLAVIVGGCSAGQSAAPPPPSDALADLPTRTPPAGATDVPGPQDDPATPTPQSLPEGSQPTGTVGAGEVLFVRGGQVWAMDLATRLEHQVTEIESDTVFRDLALSPDGYYLAAVLNSDTLIVIDLLNGVLHRRDQAAPGLIAVPVWSGDGDALFYQKIVLDAATSALVGTEIWRAAPTPGTPPERVAGADLAAGRELVPLFSLEDGLLVAARDPDEENTVLLRLSGGALDAVWTGSLPPVTLLDVSPTTGAHLLLTDSTASALYLARYSSGSGITDARSFAPTGGVSYPNAWFASDGENILALDVEDGNNAQVVLFAPGDDGYGRLLLGPDNAYAALAVAWHPAGVIAQRLPAAGGPSELWLLPLDGSPGEFLTTGESPMVVGNP